MSIDATNGDDGRTAQQASSPGTPWKTIGKAVTAGGLIGMTNKGVVLDGYTVIVQPGAYEGFESKRDGLATAPVVIKAAIPGTAVVTPAPGAAIVMYIQHHYHTVEGFVISGGATGLKLGNQGGAGVTLSGNLKPGPGSDGLNLGTDFVKVTVGEREITLWPAGFDRQGSRWQFTSSGGDLTGTFETLAYGSVTFTVQATGLGLTTVTFPIGVGARIGDDFGSVSALLSGALQVQ